jgi:hypothetical protein
MSFPAGSLGLPWIPTCTANAMAIRAVVVQAHGMSPPLFNNINPADDPSKK